MAKLMLHRDVLKHYGRLPTKVQKRVAEMIDRFEVDPWDPGIGLHGLKESMLDPKVRGADLPGAYRAIIIAPVKGDTFLLVHVDHHDEAYKWAKNKRFEVHEMTGVFQIYSSEDVEAPAKPEATKAVHWQHPVAKLCDEDLFKAGVPRPLIPALRAINSDDDLERVIQFFPPDSRDVLLYIGAGMNLDEALEEALGLGEDEQQEIRPETTGDFSNIDRAPSFELVLVEGQEDLRRALDASLEEWRIFLHPLQRKLVEWHLNGPMCVTGAAGTGKTVVILHRAAHLARGLHNTDRKILITTYTTNLVATLRDQLQRLAPEVANLIEVTNLHALARKICIQSGWSGKIATDEDVDASWAQAFSQKDLPEIDFEQRWVREEFEMIVEANGFDELDDYLTVIRSGRGRLGRAQRRSLWPRFRTFASELERRNLLTFEGAVHQARLAAELRPRGRYAHVLVDEVQDFSPEALRLIRALSPIDEGGTDPLTIVGDGHQRIYRQRVPVSRSGIEIRGRSRRLKINYRTSEEIRHYAQGVLEGLEIDDLDEGSTTTIGDRSAFSGPAPQIERCRNRQAEVDVALAWVERLIKEHGFASHEICIVQAGRDLRTLLESKAIPTYQLKPRQADPGSCEPGVRLATMYRIKGLEFRAVALLCADASDAMNHLEDAEHRDRCLRYVAATRAREFLLVTLAQ